MKNIITAGLLCSIVGCGDSPPAAGVASEVSKQAVERILRASDQLDRAASEVRNLQAAIGVYKAEFFGYPEQLSELYEAQENAPEHWFPVLKVPLAPDPWGNAYWIDQTVPNAATVCSSGPDGKARTSDDIRGR